MNANFIRITLLLVCFFSSKAQSLWQQRADYLMDVDVDAERYQYSGTQQITYTNNSPDTLYVVFFHLYPNAFQPGSEMDVHLNQIADPDRRMVITVEKDGKTVKESRISKLSADEVGFLRVISIYQDDQELPFSVNGTILKAHLIKPLIPHSSTILKTTFTGQLPVMIRRSGRNNPDGVALSMTQWYPKLAAYDYRGWNTSQYLGREFYGVWGDFDVRIHIDEKYILGGTGVLQNKNEVGHGYQDQGVKIKRKKGKKALWHFTSSNVHDFAWAADPDFKHEKYITQQGTIIHFLFKKYPENWKKLPEDMSKVFNFFNRAIGNYPWPEYSFIQGGDGGMEYAMCTLISGGKNYNSLRSTAVHELGHAWFQHAINTDETSYAWMDEGFTSFVQKLAESFLFNNPDQTNPFESAYTPYLTLARSEKEEPATTHSDRYERNSAYSIMAYDKGLIFLSQLSYVIGKKPLFTTLQKFYKKYQFKCPTPVDFIRVAEEVSGMQLGWYLNEFMETTHTVDYAIESVQGDQENTTLVLQRNGRMPLPVDLIITDTNKVSYYMQIPTAMTFGAKISPYPQLTSVTLDPWYWANPTYSVVINIPLKEIESIVIDPEELSADIHRENNIFKNTQ